MTRTLLQIAPQFLVADLQQAITYYETCLDFRQSIKYEDFYASVAKDGVEIHLKQADTHPGERDFRRANNHVDAYITVADLHRYYDFCSHNGAVITQEIQTHPWEVTDFCVTDIDGYILVFAQI